MSSDSMRKEFPDQKQRAAVCYSKWKRAKGAVEIDFIDQTVKELDKFE